MRVVSSQSSETIRKKKALEDLTAELRRLAVNLLRVIRGAGKPYELPRDIDRVAKALTEYAEAHGQFPDSDSIRSILDRDIALEEYRPWIVEGRQRRAREAATPEAQIELAISDIIDAALQIVASMFADQMTQLRTAEHALHLGVRRLKAAQVESARQFTGAQSKRDSKHRGKVK